MRLFILLIMGLTFSFFSYANSSITGRGIYRCKLKLYQARLNNVGMIIKGRLLNEKILAGAVVQSSGAFLDQGVSLVNGVRTQVIYHGLFSSNDQGSLTLQGLQTKFQVGVGTINEIEFSDKIQIIGEGSGAIYENNLYLTAQCKWNN